MPNSSKKFVRSVRLPLRQLLRVRHSTKRPNEFKLMLLLIDNYDSFAYNLAQYFGELGCELVIKRNDEISLDEIAVLAPEHICIAPGPCTPREAGISKDIVLLFGSKIPMLVVCLGHQCIAEADGGRIVLASTLVPVKLSTIRRSVSGRFGVFSRR